MNTEQVLSHIDDVLDGADDDGAVSDDAMRWSPDRISEAPIERLKVKPGRFTITIDWTDATHSSLPLSALFLSANRDLRRPQ